jgi:hypothetical protein
MTTWQHVHAGDVVAGRDGREWTVSERGEVSTWLAQGPMIRFTLLRGDGMTGVSVRPIDPAPLVRRGEGLADDAAAVELLMRQGIEVEVVSEIMAPAASTEVKRDRYGRYLLPDPATGQERSWTRATTVARTLADEYNLTQWKLRQVARGIARRPDLAAGAAAADPDADKGTLNKIAEQAMEAVASGAGATMGTALHSLTATIDRGALPPDGLSEGVTRDLVAYKKCINEHGLSVVEVERIVCLPEHGIAGTFDRIVRQPAGNAHADPLTILDVKTAKDVTYSFLETAIQLAAYAHASHVWDPATGRWGDVPPVDQTRALVLHLPSGQGRAELYGVDIAKGWHALNLAMAVREARTAGKSMGWVVRKDPAAAFLLRVRRAADQAELAALWDEGQRRGLWTPEVNAVASDRFEDLCTSD